MVVALQRFHHLHHQSPCLLLGHPRECLDQGDHLPHRLPLYRDLPRLLHGSLLSVQSHQTDRQKWVGKLRTFFCVKLKKCFGLWVNFRTSLDNFYPETHEPFSELLQF